MVFGSKWLEREANLDTLQESGTAETRTSTSGRQHGPRWFNLVQGIRRSLDVHMKSYYKVDNAFTSMMRFGSADDKLQALARGLTDTGLIDFCCVYLVHPGRGTFGVVALSGAGAELFPPLLSEAACDPTALNVFTRGIFQIQDSNWAVEDVVSSKAPWYYDCASAANGFGLPQDGSWLRRVGMRSVLALPCMAGSDVMGVLEVASRQKTLDHLLLRKLEELCYKVTPVIADAVSEYSLLLSSRRAAARYESISDFAHEVLGEMLNLDRAVAVSVSAVGSASGKATGNCTNNYHCSQKAAAATAAAIAEVAAAAAAAHQQVLAGCIPAPSCGSRGRKSDQQYDAAAAVAAAAAAGFSWTSPSVPAAASCAAAVRVAVEQPLAQQNQQQVKQQQQSDETVSPRSMNLTNTFCSVMTSGSEANEIKSDGLIPVFATPAPEPCKSSLSLSPARWSVEAPSPVVATISADSDISPAVAASSVHPVVASEPEAKVGQVDARCAAAQRSEQHASQPGQSLPHWSNGVSDKVYDYLSRVPAPAAVDATAPASTIPHPQQRQRTPQQGAPHASGGSATASSNRNVSRSARSLSCLELSGAFGVADIQEAVASGGSALTGAALMDARVFQAQAAAAMPAAVSAAISGTVRTAGSFNRSMESNTGDGYMLETLTTEDLARMPQRGFMISPSDLSSHQTDRMTIHRVAHIEASHGATATADFHAAASTCGASRLLGAIPASCAAAALAAARGSSAVDASVAGTDANATWNTNTTFGYTFTTTVGTNAPSCAGGANTGRLSGLVNGAPFDSNDGCTAAGRRHRPTADGSDLVEVLSPDVHGLVGRWSRDSAAAAACVWNNEAAEAFAAAMRFTAAQAAAPRVNGPSGSSSSRVAPSARRQCAASASSPAAAAALAFGGLYGIRESGPMSSLAFSLDTSGSISGDCGVAVLDLASSAGFVRSSGLGAEAQQRHLQGQQCAMSRSPPSDKLSGHVAEQQWLRCRAVRS